MLLFRPLRSGMLEIRTLPTNMENAIRTKELQWLCGANPHHATAHIHSLPYKRSVDGNVIEYKYSTVHPLDTTWSCGQGIPSFSQDTCGRYFDQSTAR